jgi:hypothetical protein
MRPWPKELVSQSSDSSTAEWVPGSLDIPLSHLVRHLALLVLRRATGRSATVHETIRWPFVTRFGLVSVSLSQLLSKHHASVGLQLTSASNSCYCRAQDAS